MTLDKKALEAATHAAIYEDTGEPIGVCTVGYTAKRAIQAYLDAFDPWCYDMESVQDGIELLYWFPELGEYRKCIKEGPCLWFYHGFPHIQTLMQMSATAWMHIPTPKERSEGGDSGR